jgi:serine/threonine protein kinase
MQQIEKYKIISTLEKGNYAESYKVQGKDSQDFFALKIAKEGNSELNGLIAREFTILSQFRHRNIVRVIDYGVAKSKRAYFVSEFVSGVPITSYFKGYSRELVRAMLQVLDALIQIHNRDFVHSDLKPEHIMYDPNAKRIVLIDFGFASIKNGLLPPRGTFGYIAPEILKGLNVDQRSDLYSLGVILLQMVFPSKGADGTFFSYGIRKPSNLLKMQENLPTELCEIICSLLADEPALRPTTGDIYETFVILSADKTTKRPDIKIALPQLPYADICEIVNTLGNIDNVVGNPYVILGDKGAGKTRVLNELRYKYLISGCEVLMIPAVKTHRLFDTVSDYVGLHKKPTDAENELSVFNEITRLLKNKVRDAKRNFALLIDDLDELENFDQSFARFLGFSIKDSKIALVIASERSSEIEKIGFSNFYLR